MRTIRYSTATLFQYLHNQKVATLDQLKNVSECPVAMTIFRKLKDLDYLSSCSHKGKYYTLKSIAEFDTNGIWFFDTIVFSQHGTLLDTVENLVLHSEMGYTSSELRSIIKLETKEQLAQLWLETRLAREELDGQFVYTANETDLKIRQLNCRKNQSSKKICSSSVDDAIKAAIILFISTLDEQQRRLFAGLESLREGYGGDAKIAEIFDLDQHTVAKGREQLLNRDIKIGRVRSHGAGRKAIKKNS